MFHVDTGPGNKGSSPWLSSENLCMCVCVIFCVPKLSKDYAEGLP